MKSITLEQSKETHQGRELNFDDKKLLAEIVNTPTDKINIAQMRERIKLLDKIEAAESVLDLEDAELDTLKSLVENFQFGIVSKHVLRLCEKFT